MDAKVTLSFNETVIAKAKQYADENNISLSRLTEYLLNKVTTNKYLSLEDFPISEWVNVISEGEVEYQTAASKKTDHKAEYFKNKK